MITRTDRARRLLAMGHVPAYVAHATGLHPAYVRKLLQRDMGVDHAWQKWRDQHPENVVMFRDRQNAKRREERRQRGAIPRCRSNTATQRKSP